MRRKHNYIPWQTVSRTISGFRSLFIYKIVTSVCTACCYQSSSWQSTSCWAFLGFGLSFSSLCFSALQSNISAKFVYFPWLLFLGKTKNNVNKLVCLRAVCFATRKQRGGVLMSGWHISRNLCVRMTKSVKKISIIFLKHKDSRPKKLCFQNGSYYCTFTCAEFNANEQIQ